MAKSNSKPVVQQSNSKPKVEDKKSKKVPEPEEEIEVEDVSDSDSDSEEEPESEPEPEPEDESDNDDETDKQDTKDKKEKPKKLSHKELTTELLNNEEKISKLGSEIDELETKLKACVRDQNALRRTNLRLIKQLDKAHDDDVNKARKEKKKRNVTEDSGILKNKPIPPVLIKFLDLKEGTELPRTKVMSLLSNKFRDLGLRKGQDIELDKKTAKIFGKEDGYIIEFKYFQRFLKIVYEDAGLKTTEVSL
jgi:regulator of replication initiation timing